MSGVDRLLEMSVELAKAHLSASSVETTTIPSLIEDIYRTLKGLSGGGQPADLPALVSDNSGSSEVAGAEPSVINSDVSGPDFDGLDPWLAARLHRRIARRLNREPSIHPSVFPDYLICLEDGEKVKLLRPYIKNRFGLSIANYLDRWNLPDNYPVAPPAFIEAKREKAKAFGLGVTTRGPRGPSRQRNVKPETRSRKRSRTA